MHAVGQAASEVGHEPSASLLRQCFAATSTPVLITDAHGTICHANPAFEQNSGYSISELVGQTPGLFRSQMQGVLFYRSMWSSLMSRQRWHGEIWNRRKDGRVLREWLSISALLGEDGEVSHYLAVYAGVPELQHTDSDGRSIGGLDATTGVLNRCAFISAAQSLHDRLGQLALISLDIDRFTELNEQLGLDAGDALLRRVAIRCTQIGLASNGQCVVGRVGPDEFALAWLPQSASNDDSATWDDAALLALADRLRHEVNGHYEQLQGTCAVNITVSLGIAHMPANTANAAEALLHASAARQDARGGNLPLLSYATHENQRQLARALREAILTDEIQVALQPKVGLASGALLGMEALARWTTADGRAVPPAEFIPVAEQRGMIAELGDRVLEKVLALLAQWQAAGHELVPIAVNFSAQQFHRRDAPERIRQALLRHGIAPALLELELTESVLLGDVDTALPTLAELRQLGVKVAIDDFGTGYSSLAYLRRFPVDCLKIDRSFVSELCTDAPTREIVRVIIELAQQFKLSCVAEGVETMEQLTLLRELGCEQGQGYLLARPLPADMIGELMAMRVPWMPLFALF